MTNCSACKFGLMYGLRCSLNWSPPVGCYTSCHLFEKKEASMGTCKECKWRNGGLPKNYICFYQEGISQFRSCSWFEKDETEQKGALMSTCKECKWWRQFDEHPGAGECRCLNVGTKEPYLGIISTYEFEGKDYMSPKVPSSFGCVHFEQRAKEPFGIREEKGHTVLTLYDKFNVRFNACADCHGTIVYLCDWLNEHWRE